MGTVAVVIEHRRSEVRDISFEMLFKAGEICRKGSHILAAVVLEGKDEDFGELLKKRADRVIVYKDDRLNHFSDVLYKEILCQFIREEHPFLTLLGHTSWGMELAPALSIKTGYPLVSDCVDIVVDDDQLQGIRQIYNGKIFSRVSLRKSDGYMFSIREGYFTLPEGIEPRKGELVYKEIPSDLSEPRKKFIEFSDTASGEVDITQADLLVSIGRGVGEEEKIEAVKELADLLGGTMSCSRPIVDRNWLPGYLQVGTSGKSVKPKVYFALGISGAFQHVAGISGAGTIIGVNKDKKAPIFRVADYGVVDDLFSIVDAMKEKLKAGTNR